MALPKLVMFAAASDVRDSSPATVQLLGRFGGLGPVRGKGAGGVRRRNLGAQHVQLGQSKGVKGSQATCIIEGSTFSSFIPKDDRTLTGCGFDHKCPDKEMSEKLFLFEKQRRDGTLDSKYDFKEKCLAKGNFSIPPLPKDFQNQKPSHIHRLPLHKDFSQGLSKPFAFSSYEGYDVPSIPAIFLPDTTSSVNEKRSSSIDTCKNRPRINNRTCSLFTIAANQKSYAYADPVHGAPASFIQRLSEISSLESETVRQERIKKLKKNKRQESYKQCLSKESQQQSCSARTFQLSTFFPTK
ncbi:putative uncharacterized protein C8orf89 homolog [Amia ocellicauda]|uniref:putative uncharacterized protein C8orf89 homolog n=1 Tax=Amia ocellicauda TaxID=2972642 RepID=UPI0034646068